VRALKARGALVAVFAGVIFAALVAVFSLKANDAFLTIGPGSVGKALVAVFTGIKRDTLVAVFTRKIRGAPLAGIPSPSGVAYTGAVAVFPATDLAVFAAVLAGKTFPIVRVRMEMGVGAQVAMFTFVSLFALFAIFPGKRGVAVLTVISGVVFLAFTGPGFFIAGHPVGALNPFIGGYTLPAPTLAGYLTGQNSSAGLAVKGVCVHRTVVVFAVA